MIPSYAPGAEEVDEQEPLLWGDCELARQRARNALDKDRRENFSNLAMEVLSPEVLQSAPSRCSRRHSSKTRARTNERSQDADAVGERVAHEHHTVDARWFRLRVLHVAVARRVQRFSRPSPANGGVTLFRRRLARDETRDYLQSHGRDGQSKKDERRFAETAFRLPTC